MVNAETSKKDEIKDPFAFIHTNFIKDVRPNAVDERNQIFGHLDQLKNDLKSHKQKILKQQEKLEKQKSQGGQDTKKQEELVKKQSNQCMIANVKKTEETFRKVQ